jgi:hypothetical protein
LTPSGVRCRPSLRILMPLTVQVKAPPGQTTVVRSRIFGCLGWAATTVAQQGVPGVDALGGVFGPESAVGAIRTRTDDDGDARDPRGRPAVGAEGSSKLSRRPLRHRMNDHRSPYGTGGVVATGRHP